MGCESSELLVLGSRQYLNLILLFIIVLSLDQDNEVGLEWDNLILYFFKIVFGL